MQSPNPYKTYCLLMIWITLRKKVPESSKYCISFPKKYSEVITPTSRWSLGWFLTKSHTSKKSHTLYEIFLRCMIFFGLSVWVHRALLWIEAQDRIIKIIKTMYFLCEKYSKLPLRLLGGLWDGFLTKISYTQKCEIFRKCTRFFEICNFESWEKSRKMHRGNIVTDSIPNL